MGRSVLENEIGLHFSPRSRWTPALRRPHRENLLPHERIAVVATTDFIVDCEKTLLRE